MPEAPPLTPEERSLRARLAAHELHSRVNSLAHTAPARAASPGSLTWHERAVDPDGILDPTERRRRAEHHKSAHFARLALKSARARRQRKVSP